MAERAVSVLIVDDHRLVAEGLSALLSEQPRVRVAGVAGTVAGAVSASNEARPDVVLMDFRLPDGDGTLAARRIKEGQPEVAVLFISADPSDDAMLKAVEAGACGYLPKDAAPDELLSAIMRAAEGEFLLPAATMQRLLARQREVRRQQYEQQRMLEELTPREREILGLMADGNDNRAIASELGIAYGTVRTHVRSLLEKLESSSRLQAVATARERRLL